MIRQHGRRAHQVTLQLASPPPASRLPLRVALDAANGAGLPLHAVHAGPDPRSEPSLHAVQSALLTPLPVPCAGCTCRRRSSATSGASLLGPLGLSNTHLNVISARTAPGPLPSPSSPAGSTGRQPDEQQGERVLATGSSADGAGN